MKKTKILVSSALALCMGATAAIPAFAVTPNFTYTKIGDYNSDNAVNVADVTALQMQLSGGGTVTGAALEHTDFNGDGSFNVNDISEMQKMVAGSDFSCYQETDSSYRDISCVWTNYYSDDNILWEAINYETLCDSDNYVISEKEVDSDDLGFHLITSKEQFCNMFKAYSPEFDDEFFSENTLLVWLGIGDASDSFGINSIGIEDNALAIQCYSVDDYNKSHKNVCSNIIVKLNKSDVANIDGLHCYELMLAQ